MIRPETIIEFKDDLKQEYGKDVTLEQAGLILSDLVVYFDTLAKVHYQTNTND